MSGGGRALAVGSYADTDPSVDNDTNSHRGPLLCVTRRNQACGGFTGTFQISELAFDANGGLTRFSAVFEQFVAGEDRRGTFGSIAYRATNPAAPVPHGPPKAVADVVAQGTVDGATLTWKNPPANFVGLVVRASNDPEQWIDSPTGGLPVYSGTAETASITGFTAERYGIWYFPATPKASRARARCSCWSGPASSTPTRTSSARMWRRGPRSC